MAQNLYWKIREQVAEELHKIWTGWSHEICATEKLSEARIKRWNTHSWMPYKELSVQKKEVDRALAEQVIDSIPMIRCPVYQCGGFMKTVEKAKPKKLIEESYSGDFQTPLLVCTNCKAVYVFRGFKK